MALSGGARSASTVSGTVLAGGAPLQGAIVTVAGPQQPPVTQRTGSDGTFSIDVSSTPCTVGVSAAGYKSRAVPDVTVGSVGSIALVPSTYTPLPVHAGSGQFVRADATTGIFYAFTSLDIYRSLDYGGTWQPVTMSYDDPNSGVQGWYPDAMAVSSVSGEVAVVIAGGETAIFSTDYGLSWRKVAGDFYADGSTRQNLPAQLFWGHAGPGAPSVLLAVKPAADGSGTLNVWRADMSAAEPAFVKEPTDPFGAGSVIAVADSAGGTFAGRVSAAGALSFASLTASGPITFGAEEAAGLPSPPLLLRLGGAKEAAAPPDGALVVGGGGSYQAVMLTKDAGVASFAGASRSAATDLADTSTITRLRSGSVAPTSMGTEGFGTVGSTWVEKSGSGTALTFPGFVADGSDMAYDALYGQPGNLVAIMPSASQGPMKWAKVDGGGAPVFDSKIATGGTGAETGGYSITGITSPIVNDTAYGPAGAGDVAVAAQHVMMASKDGGTTMTEVLPRTAGLSAAVQWWQGASGEWLLFGHGFAVDTMLSALRNWDGAATLSGPNVVGSSRVQLGGPAAQGFWDTGGYVVGSLASVPGTDTVFIGNVTQGEDKYGSGDHLFRARLTPTDPPALADLASLDPAPGTATLYGPLAMAYASDDPSVPEVMRDVLFVATGQGGFANPASKGALLRIAGATTSSPSVGVVDSIPHDTDQTVLNDVRVDAAHGVVYAGGNGSGQTGPGLYKSVDGGLTFTRLTVTAPDGSPASDLPGVTAMG
jgi:hypothetical protein